MGNVNLPDSISTILQAWEELAPDAIFSEMTREQFLAASQPTVATRSRISTLDLERKASLATRRASDQKTRELVQRVVNSVKSSPGHGENSALYRALGYKTKSERNSGLTRKKRVKPGTPQ